MTIARVFVSRAWGLASAVSRRSSSLAISRASVVAFFGKRTWHCSRVYTHTLRFGLSGVGVSEYKKKFLSVKKKIEPLECATTDAQRALRGREAAKECFRVTNEYPGGAPMQHMVEFDQC